MEIFTLIAAVAAGYLIFNAFHYPKGTLGKKLPVIKFKNTFQISPTIQIYFKNKFIHFHHWFALSMILAVSFFSSSIILDSIYTKGFLIGAIIQGLKFPDRHIIKKS
jgi:hypothetical protein